MVYLCCVWGVPATPNTFQSVTLNMSNRSRPVYENDMTQVLCGSFALLLLVSYCAVDDSLRSTPYITTRGAVVGSVCEFDAPERGLR